MTFPPIKGSTNAIVLNLNKTQDIPLLHFPNNILIIT